MLLVFDTKGCVEVCDWKIKINKGGKSKSIKGEDNKIQDLRKFGNFFLETLFPKKLFVLSSTYLLSGLIVFELSNDII